MQLLLNNKTALITGAGRGIGKATALLFAQQGAHVLLASRTKSELEKLAQVINRKGGRASIVPCDLNTEQDIKRLAVQACEANTDILINNAGWGVKGAFHKLSPKDMNSILDVNLRAPMLLTQRLLPHLIAKKSGCIVNIASMAGKLGMPHSVTYCASKHGLVGFSNALFEEVRAHSIKVSVICPGFVDTSLVPQTRKINRTKMIRPEDIAQACLFVATASPESCPVEIIVRPQQSPYHH